MIKKIVEAYINEINNVYANYNKISQKFSDDKTMVNDSIEMAIILICIKYESFTSELYGYVFDDINVQYNRPWFYTRKCAHALKINIEKEYKKAHEAWYFYNTLKHVNFTTKVKKEKIMQKMHVNSINQVLIWIHFSIIEILKKFLNNKIKYI